MKKPYHMTDAELSNYIDCHEEDEDAFEEWALRRDCRNDSRVAQALGCATGRDNEPS